MKVDLEAVLRQIAYSGCTVTAAELRDMARDAIAQTQGAQKDCPHAAPFLYCQTCVVTPCPIGLLRP